MPRGARLDASGILHHVMIRGLERRAIFRDARDRAEFLRRLATLGGPGALVVYAWALLPNHAHLLVRTGNQPLARSMRALLAGYAGYFNRRHRRVGHLFQNRYKSIVVDEETYFLELVRYLHLNPLRAGLVRDLAAMARYPWTGHSALLGHIHRPWQALTEVLGHFHRQVGPARSRYGQFVAEGVEQGRRPDLQGGGLRRSAGGWQAVVALRRGRERWAHDERVLGSGPFVERLLREVASAGPPRPRARALAALPALLTRCATAFGVTPAELQAGGRRRSVAHARAVVAALAVRELAIPISQVAAAVGVSPTAVRLGLASAEKILRARGLTAADLVPRK